MTDPLGKYWDAPDRSEISMSLAFAWMTKRSFDKLHTYQSSIPTGEYIGKMWKKQDRRGRWMLVYYDVDPEPGFLSIKYFRIGIEP